MTMLAVNCSSTTRDPHEWGRTSCVVPLLIVDDAVDQQHTHAVGIAWCGRSMREMKRGALIDRVGPGKAGETAREAEDQHDRAEGRNAAKPLAEACCSQSSP